VNVPAMTMFPLGLVATRGGPTVPVSVNPLLQVVGHVDAPLDELDAVVLDELDAVLEELDAVVLDELEAAPPRPPPPAPLAPATEPRQLQPATNKHRRTSSFEGILMAIHMVGCAALPTHSRAMSNAPFHTLPAHVGARW
jgi:hypothetical protein